MEKIQKLELSNSEKYINYFENEMTKVGNIMVESGHIPFIIHSACSCGCGETSYQINDDIISKQQAVKLLLHTAEIIKQELSNLN